MIRIEGTRWTDGLHGVYDLQVSTTSDLPALGASLVGLRVAAGTIAQCIQDGKFYTLDGDGSWYDSDGNEAS